MLVRQHSRTGPHQVGDVRYAGIIGGYSILANLSGFRTRIRAIIIGGKVHASQSLLNVLGLSLVWVLVLISYRSVLLVLFLLWYYCPDHIVPEYDRIFSPAYSC